MYEDLIQRLRTITPWETLLVCKNTMHEAADAIDKQNVIISGLNETIKMYENETPQWIPVTERLPESQGPFLTRYGFGDTSIETGQFFYGVLDYLYADAEPHWQHASVGVEVTHWMPLPAPPALDTDKQP